MVRFPGTTLNVTRKYISFILFYFLMMKNTDKGIEEMRKIKNELSNFSFPPSIFEAPFYLRALFANLTRPI